MSSTTSDEYLTDGKGYWNLARQWLFTSNEDAIFSRCSDLVIFDLLLRQAELCKYRKDLLVTSDGTGSSALLGNAKSWQEMHSDGQALPELNTWCTEVRPKLLQYQDVLNGAIKCAALPPVELRRINHIEDLLGEGYIELTGLDKAVYYPHRADIVALKKEMYDDPVSSFIGRSVVPRALKILDRLPKSKKAKDSKTLSVSGKSIQAIGSIIGTVGAAGYLLAAITTLYNVHSMSRRLAIIAGFSIAHAILLCLFRPPNLESINAIATFAAVEVIFVATNVPSTNTTVTNTQ